MGLVYHNGKFIPEEHIQKNTEKDRVLRLLRSFLDQNEPGLVRILVNTWNSQGNAITYKELREAILTGTISSKYLEDWMQDYSKLVRDQLQPAWEKAIKAGAEEKERKYPTFHFDPMGDGVRAWTADHAAEFVTNVTNAQIEGLRSVVQRAASLEDLTVDELSRVIRPMVGLTKPQAMANMKYYETLRANGVTPKKARESAIRYAARQHRQRGYDIARTELATAYNRGAHEGTKQAQARGYLGKVRKVWCTADDERVCKTICDPLDGKEWEMDDDILYEYKYKRTGIVSVRRINPSLEGAAKHPPAHPGCRCALLYMEIT